MVVSLCGKEAEIKHFRREKVLNQLHEVLNVPLITSEKCQDMLELLPASAEGGNSHAAPKMASSSNQVAVRSLKDDGVNQLVDQEHASKALSTDLVNLAQEVAKADTFVRANVGSKLQVIVEQIRFLQGQAERILQEAKRNNDLHHVACNSKKIAGNLYSMYERPNGQRYMSLISPQEWGSACPHTFVGTYRLENDHSWTPEEDIQSRDTDHTLIEQILQSRSLLAISEPEAEAEAHVPSQ